MILRKFGPPQGPPKWSKLVFFFFFWGGGGGFGFEFRVRGSEVRVQGSSRRLWRQVDGLNVLGGPWVGIRVPLRVPLKGSLGIL